MLGSVPRCGLQKSLSKWSIFAQPGHGRHAVQCLHCNTAHSCKVRINTQPLPQTASRWSTLRHVYLWSWGGNSRTQRTYCFVYWLKTCMYVEGSSVLGCDAVPTFRRIQCLHLRGHAVQEMPDREDFNVSTPLWEPKISQTHTFFPQSERLNKRSCRPTCSKLMNACKWNWYGGRHCCAHRTVRICPNVPPPGAPQNFIEIETVVLWVVNV